MNTGRRLPLTACPVLVGMVLAWGCSGLALAGSGEPSSDVRRRVFTLDQDEWGRPFYLAAYAALRQMLVDEFQGRIIVCSESMDLARFNRPGYLAELKDWIKRKYRDFAPDVLIVAGEESLVFAQSLRAELWPEAAIVFGAIPEEVLANRPLPPNCTGVVHADYHLRDTVTLATRLLPETRRIAFIAGDVAREPFNRALYREFQQLGDRFETIDLTNLPMSELTARIAALPDDTIVFYSTVFIDGSGKIWGGPQALKQFAPVANRPLFCQSETYLGLGVTGGQMLRSESLAQDLGRQAIRVLQGEPASTLPVTRQSCTAPMFDARELRRWRIPLARLPSDSIVRFQEVSVWEAYRWPIAGVLSVLLIQSVLLAGLLFQRLRRRSAERHLRESQEYLALAGESGDVGLWGWEPATGRLTLSAKSRELIGASPTEPVDPRQFEEHVHPDDRPPRQAALEAALAGQAHYDIEYRILRTDGQVRWLASRGSVERDKKGTVCRVKGVLTDVSRRKAAEAESERRRDEAAHVARIATLSELAASISHELGQPLMAILNFAEAAKVLLAAEPADVKDVQPVLASIQREGLRAKEIIAKVRGLFQKRPPRRELIQAEPLLHEVVELLRGMASRREVLVRADCPDSIPEVYADRVCLQQALLNLAMNGMDASGHLPPLQREVVLALGRDAAGGVVFRVSDRGTGIPGGTLAEIFQPFYSTKPDGLGLGLALVRTIAETHGGRAWAENNPDGGATVSFVLPAVGGERCVPADQ